MRENRMKEVLKTGKRYSTRAENRKKGS